MKKRIFIALLILIAFFSISVISASEIDVNDAYAVQDSSLDVMSVDELGIGSDSNSLSINNVDTSSDVNIVGVDNKATVIDAPEINLYYKNGTRFIATLSDIDGHKLANQTLIFTISGVDYSRTTDANGSASVAINLLPGTRDITVSYAGDNTYSNSEVTSKCTVYPNVIADNVVKYFRNDTQYYATFLDGQGNPLVNASVSFNINGLIYTRTTNGSGVARLNINLLPNDYVLTAIHPNGYACSNTITVLSTISSDDIVKMQGNGTQYYATFLDGQGNPLANGTAVSFNINGMNYNRNVNENGTARLNINLGYGNYIITATNLANNELYSNTITVLPKITENSNLIKYFKNDSQYVVKVLGNDGNPVGEGKSVTFNINGALYERKTNGSSYARLNINLQPGQYIITTTYDGCSVSNSIVVISILGSNDISMLYKDGTKFKTKLVDGQGNAVVGQNVSFNINGVFYNRTTNAEGIAALNINLGPGEYVITSSYNDAIVSNKVLIKPVTLSIYDILATAFNLKNYYEHDGVFLSTIKAGPAILTQHEFFYLMNKAVEQIAASNFNDVPIIYGIDNPVPYNGETLYSCLAKKAEYVELARNAASDISKNNQVPDAVGTKYGALSHEDYTYLLTKILSFYLDYNGDLPNYVTVVSKNKPTIVTSNDAINPYGLSGKKVFIDADGGSDAKKWDLARALLAEGWDVTVGDTFSNAHYEDYFNVPSNYVLITLYNGFCAGTIRELASSYIQNILKAKNVVCVPIWDTAGWTNPDGMGPYRYGDFSGYSAKRAWDDNFSITDPSITNVDQFLYSNHIKYCAYPTTDGIIYQFTHGGYFATVGR